jgi:Cu2+-exporting ATPase
LFRFFGIFGLPFQANSLSQPGPKTPGQVNPVRFRFSDPVREDAAATVAWLRRAGKDVQLLSGDHPATVEAVARATGIDVWSARVTPAEKVTRLEALARSGRRVLMIGDGLNDAAALAAAHASLSPATAADVTQAAADGVFQGDRLAPVVSAMLCARRADLLVRENLTIALLYNLLASPLAVAGLVTPLIATAVMSGSSIIVVVNAMRASGPEGSLPWAFCFFCCQWRCCLAVAHSLSVPMGAAQWPVRRFGWRGEPHPV